ACLNDPSRSCTSLRSNAYAFDGTLLATTIAAGSVGPASARATPGTTASTVQSKTQPARKMCHRVFIIRLLMPQNRRLNTKRRTRRHLSAGGAGLPPGQEFHAFQNQRPEGPCHVLLSAPSGRNLDPTRSQVNRPRHPSRRNLHLSAGNAWA